MSLSSKTISAPLEKPVAQNYVKIIAAIMTFGSLAWSADLYRQVGVVILMEQYLSGMLGLALTLVYLRYPVIRNTERFIIPWYDKIAALVA
jgi:TRAP-type uncharacterized transport system fused permease subunit